MSAIVIRGREVADQVLDDVAEQLRARLEAGRSRPHLAVVLVGHDPASETYVRGKRQDAERVGIASSDHRLPESATTAEVLELVARLN
ncbi:MAG: tetrahydrofolate dehydrogenase/cyclohydrolase catalytic domain-containing protein, partial [Chloroflexota bacterium]